MGKLGAVVLLFAAVSTSGCTLVFSPRAYLERRACLELKPGMSERQVVKIMGEPQEQLIRAPGERVLYYRWLFNDTGPMHVVLTEASSGYAVRYAACEGTG